jgi:hypothetical protein
MMLAASATPSDEAETQLFSAADTAATEESAVLETESDMSGSGGAADGQTARAMATASPTPMPAMTATVTAAPTLTERQATPPVSTVSSQAIAITALVMGVLLAGMSVVLFRRASLR